MKKNYLSKLFYLIAFTFTIQYNLLAQINLPGFSWQYVTNPGLKLQLQRKNPSNYHMIYFKDFVSGREEHYNFCKFTYTGDTTNYSDAVYKFIITGDPNASRSEMKIEYNNYQQNGVYQMEGEMRFTVGSPGPNHVCQVWQNMIRSQNKILIYSMKTSDSGTLYVPSNQDRWGTFTPLKNVYTDYNNENDKWLKVNIIHNRVAREVSVYLNGELYNKYTHYEADGDYYFKFGAYGKPSGVGTNDCIIEWRNMKFFEAETDKTEKPAAPGNLKAYPVSSSEIRLTWTDESILEDQFKIEISEDSTNFTLIDSVTANKTTFLADELKAGEKYFFRIKAENQIGSSEFASVSEKTFPENVMYINDSETGTGLNQFNYSGNWSVVSGQNGNYNNDFTESNLANSTFSLQFSGTKIHVYGKKKPDSGTAGFGIDGAQMTVGDFHAPEETKKARIWSSEKLAPRNHTLNMLVLEHKLCRIDFVVVEPEEHILSSNDFKKTEGGLHVYPNPTNGMVTISFNTVANDRVKLTIFNLAGQPVKTLRESYETAGNKTLRFVTAGDLQSGIYFIQLITSSTESLVKFIVK
ncbi:MAG TPA: T9SS type A sorting domain-containing protein [Mariniphaga anaerophila]|uniref:T9SS type A sorting domain-containing protein n=1 Tax=Mariniphaga anaerophila TaxID=1484053 RepID=A0A831LDL3_9BACT|nr:T9SS type A sorting domain-containing protein [Mariniphaga anaerophila]